jgi:epsilon-lactone hydrolase
VNGSRGVAIVRQHLRNQPAPESLTLAELRAQYDRAERVFRVPLGTAVERVRAGDVPAEWIRPVTARDGSALLYLHGGGYVIGSTRSHRHLAAAIGRAAGAPVLLPEYRLAPEHPFPAALEDAVAAYRWLLGRGVNARRVVVAGDSAGGGLTIAMLVVLRDRGVPLPAGAVCISPWVDLACSGDSYTTKAAVDPIVRQPWVAQMAKAYLAGADLATPLASPLYADLRGLPAILVQVGSDEVLLDDSAGLAARAQVAGVDTRLEVWDGMVHVWHWFLTILDEADRAVTGIGEFARARLG